jgi:hypothetical protein
MADIVDDAVGPDEKAGTAWDRVFVTPATGSAFELGQGLRIAFFCDDQVLVSELELCPASVSCEPLVATTVEAEEFELNEDEELER